MRRMFDSRGSRTGTRGRKPRTPPPEDTGDPGLQPNLEQDFVDLPESIECYSWDGEQGGQEDLGSSEDDESDDYLVEPLDPFGAVA